MRNAGLCAVALCLGAAVAMAQNGTGSSAATASSGQVQQSTISANSQPAMASSSNREVQQQIKNAVKNDPMLSNVNPQAVQVNVAPRKIVLRGDVNDKQEKDNIVRIAQSYSSGRTVVDQLKERPSTKGNLANAPTSNMAGGSTAAGQRQNQEKKKK